MPEEIVENAEAGEVVETEGAERDSDSEESGAADVSELEKKFTSQIESLKKELSGRDRKIAELQKERMSDEERREAEEQEVKKMILEERSLRIKAENKAVARDLLDEAGVKVRVPRILDDLIKDDPDATREAVNAYIEDKRLDRAEDRKEHDRNNGRRVTTSKEHDNLTYADLVGMTDQQLAQVPDSVKDAIMEKAIKKE